MNQPVTRRRPAERPQGATRERILDAAEQLFAARGAAAVSLREINAACGISQGVIHYHFGGRDGLLEALLHRRLPALTERRRQMVTQWHQRPGAPTLYDLMSLIALPLAELAIDGGAAGARFVRVMVRLQQERNPVYERLAAHYITGVGFDLGQGLAALLPELPHAQVELRLRIAHDTLFQGLSQLHEPPLEWQHALQRHPVTPQQRLATLIAMVTEGLKAPSV